MHVFYGVEGITDVPVVEHIIRLLGLEPRQASASGGKTYLDPKVRRWNAASNRSRFLVLRDWDLDDKATCPAELIVKVAGEIRAPRLAVRVPVRSIEAWLLADQSAFKKYFMVTTSVDAPDELLDPKGELVSICRKSRSSTIRDDMVPREASRRRVGPGFEGRLTEFSRDHWDPVRARLSSPSLDRSLNRLQQLVEDGVW